MKSYPASEESRAKMYEYGIPEYMHGSLIRYFEEHIPPGHFLTAVLENDFMGVFMHADERNILALKGYSMWMYNEAPGRYSGSWGSKEAVAKWLAMEEIEESEDTIA